jgi:hypothetical protein
MSQQTEPATLNLGTICGQHGYRTGDMIFLTVSDRRWWRRLWYFVTFRGSPTITTTHKVTAVSSTTFGVE